ncbi:hypothetical protein phytr_3660 [Candidatus Phycorickettsia trachydisci]|uniref:Autotransporter domain-containing protein n=1 Tax=Candidatus Phycorickettsia trachydisci TaxID=2115978 RepID=A0A2P1P7T1_9RICK|nr:autotransporter domain-containing protein [Candidatus Phycorickettsia trachydisci]AVP87317.1 hypothetical protein phytr_3660 [Candidatus Phycorickettsia trachydisci]
MLLVRLICWKIPNIVKLQVIVVSLTLVFFAKNVLAVEPGSNKTPNSVSSGISTKDSGSEGSENPLLTNIRTPLASDSGSEGSENPLLTDIRTPLASDSGSEGSENPLLTNIRTPLASDSGSEGSENPLLTNIRTPLASDSGSEGSENRPAKEQHHWIPYNPPEEIKTKPQTLKRAGKIIVDKLPKQDVTIQPPQTIQTKAQTLKPAGKIIVDKLPKQDVTIQPPQTIQTKAQTLKPAEKIVVNKLPKQDVTIQPSQTIQTKAQTLKPAEKIVVNKLPKQDVTIQPSQTIQTKAQTLKPAGKIIINKLPKQDVTIQPSQTIQTKAQTLKPAGKIIVNKLPKQDVTIQPPQTIQTKKQTIEPAGQIVVNKPTAKEVSVRAPLKIQTKPQTLKPAGKIIVNKLPKQDVTIQPPQTVQTKKQTIEPAGQIVVNKPTIKEVSVRAPLKIQTKPQTLKPAGKIIINKLPKQDVTIPPPPQIQTKPRTLKPAEKLEIHAEEIRQNLEKGVLDPNTSNQDALFSLKYIHNISHMIFFDSMDLVSRILQTRLYNLSQSEISTLAAAGENDPVKKGLWIKGLSSFSKQKPKKNDLGYNNHQKGFAIGTDIELIKDLFTAGIAYTNTFSKTKFRGITITKDNIQKTNLHIITLYGEYVLSPKVRLNTNLNYGKAFIKTERNNQNILYLGKTKGELFRAQTEVSYKTDYNKIFSLLPKIGITFDKFSINSFKETSPNLSLNVGRKKITRIAANIGVRLIKRMKMREFEVTPGISINIEQAIFTKGNRNIITTIGNQSQSVVSDVVKPAKTTYAIGTFLSACKKSIELNLVYDYTFKRRYHSHSTYASLLFKF